MGSIGRFFNPPNGFLRSATAQFGLPWPADSVASGRGNRTIIL